MKVRTYLQLGRVSNLPTVWTNVLAGAVLSGAPLAPGALLLAAAALSLFYVGGMLLNDAFDRKWDAAMRPERPIPSGRVGAREVFGAGFGLLGVGLVLVAASGGRGAAAAGLALAGTIVLYDAWHKGNPLSPLLMGLCRVLVYVTAALAVSGRITDAVVAGAAVLLAYLIGLSYAAKQETLAEVRNLWPLACLAAPFAYYGVRAPAGGALALLLAAALALWVAWSVSLLVRRPPSTPRAVVSLIAGISLLDGLLAALHGAGPLALGGVGGFALTLFLQRYVRGT
jgi:4-hydroxybenzoate polyprenyltransferase